ncbi:MAG: M48 family metalloprotease [Candidatus Dependentiae bacterium]|nr:M48 family metalloprotease [Candidatus Dependentiae bacterium]
MIIFRFKALAISCLALSSFLNLNGQPVQDLLVKDHYIGAQIWFEKMTQKYPVAQLDNVLFCISDEYLSRTNTIYWPEIRLQAIDKAYTTQNSNDLENMFKQDEYLLLHEAAHVLKNHNQKGYVALALTCAAFAALNGYILEQSFKNKSTNFDKVKLSIQALIGNVAILTALASYVQIQERQADDFANQYGDDRSLQAGADWTARIEECMLQDQQFSEFTKNLIILYQDPWHPLPASRQQKVIDALALRQANLLQA